MHQCVLEHILPPVARPALGDQLAPLEVLQVRLEGACFPAGDRRDDPVLEARSDYRGHLSQALRTCGQAVDPGHEEFLDRAGDRHRFDLLGERERVVLVLDDPLVDEIPHHLFDE